MSHNILKELGVGGGGSGGLKPWLRIGCAFSCNEIISFNVFCLNLP